MASEMAVIPQDWGKEIIELLESAQTIISKDTAEAFKLYDSRATACLIAKSESEMMAYLNWYVIWKHQLWKAEHDAWEDYCDGIASQPFGISKSDLKHKIGTIDKGLKRGAEIVALAQALADKPYAVQQMIGTEDANLPEKSVQDTLVRWQGLNAGEAVADFKLASGKPTIVCREAVHDKQNSQILFKLMVRPPDDPTYERDYVIKAVDEDEGDWIMDRLGPKKRTVYERKPANV